MALYRSSEYQTSFESMGISVQEKKFKTDFQDSGCSSNLLFLIGTISAIFALQITPMLPTKFPASWPSVSGVEVQSRSARWQTSWISDLIALAVFFFFFLSTSRLDTSYQVSSQLPFRLRRSSK